jgi:hypothetical protein
MIRQISACAITVALVAGMALPVLAQGTQTAPAPAAPAAPAAKAPAKTDAPKAAVVKPKSATGTVKTASAESLVVLDKDKKEWTFAVAKDTKIMKGGKAVEPKDLAENDPVTIQFTEADGKMTAKTVTVKTTKAATKAPAKKPAS